MGNAVNPQLVDIKPYPKAIFTLADLEGERSERLLDSAISAEITEDATSFYLTTTWPALATLPASANPAPAPMAAVLPAAVAALPAAAVVVPAAVAVAQPAVGPTSYTTSGNKGLEALRGEYQALFDACTTTDAHLGDVAEAVAQVRAGEARYQALSRRVGGQVPWQFIGIVHLLEASCRFGRHLHNGDPMQAGPAGSATWLRTTHKPPDRPPVWPAPDSEPDPWVWSGIDALATDGFDRETDWSVPTMLWRFERYNGMGYRQFGNPTPYLWSFSQIYSVGKFASDGRYDAGLVSGQCGAALVLKAL